MSYWEIRHSFQGVEDKNNLVSGPGFCYLGGSRVLVFTGRSRNTSGPIYQVVWSRARRLVTRLVFVKLRDAIMVALFS